MATINYCAGDTIFREGDRSAGAYLVLEWEVEIRKNDNDREVWLAVLSEGEVFGEMGLVEERPRSATARARTDVALQQVAYHEFVDMLVNQPRESMRYVKRLMERLRVVSARVAHLHPEMEEEVAFEAPKGQYRVKIYGETSEAAKAVSAEGFGVERFPFRVGRASRRASEDPLQTNHLRLMDSATYHVSRNHFSLDLKPEGVLVEDRGSYLGTLVNGISLGGGRSDGKAILTEGENTVIPGGPNSPFQFIISVEYLA